MVVRAVLTRGKCRPSGKSRSRQAIFAAVTTTLFGATCAQTVRAGYTAANTKDFQPASGVNYTVMTGIMGTQQSGYGQESALPTHNPLALLWATDPTQAYNLEPTGFSSSHVNATNGIQQVGEVITNTPKVGHATLWNF